MEVSGDELLRVGDPIIVTRCFLWNAWCSKSFGKNLKFLEKNKNLKGNRDALMYIGYEKSVSKHWRPLYTITLIGFFFHTTRKQSDIFDRKYDVLRQKKNFKVWFFFLLSASIAGNANSYKESSLDCSSTVCKPRLVWSTIWMMSSCECFLSLLWY